MSYCLLLSCLILLPTQTPAADLAKVERTIVKEPAYRSGDPRYCLLLFGPAARTRMWVVVDGTDIYIDKNCDGDLTTPGEKYTNDGADFQPFEIADHAGLDRYVIHKLYIDSRDTEFKGVLDIRVEIKGKYRQHCTPVMAFPEDKRRVFQERGMPLLARQAKDAPLCHFHGSLVFRLDQWKNESRLVHGDQPGEVFAVIGTFDAAHGCFVVITTNWLEVKNGQRLVRLFPTDVEPAVHPIAEIEFPAQTPGQPPIKQIYELQERC